MRKVEIDLTSLGWVGSSGVGLVLPRVEMEETWGSISWDRHKPCTCNLDEDRTKSEENLVKERDPESKEWVSLTWPTLTTHRLSQDVSGSKRGSVVTTPLSPLTRVFRHRSEGGNEIVLDDKSICQYTCITTNPLTVTYILSVGYPIIVDFLRIVDHYNVGSIVESRHVMEKI